MKNSQNISELNKVTQSKYQVEGLIFPFKPDCGSRREVWGRESEGRWEERGRLDKCVDESRAHLRTRYLGENVSVFLTCETDDTGWKKWVWSSSVPRKRK